MVNSLLHLVMSLCIVIQIPWYLSIRCQSFLHATVIVGIFQKSWTQPAVAGYIWSCNRFRYITFQFGIIGTFVTSEIGVWYPNKLMLFSSLAVVCWTESSVGDLPLWVRLKHATQWCLQFVTEIQIVLCYVLLQPLQVNLNLMLCPMELDPFYGPYYRIIAVAHQAILCPLTCKVFCAISSLFLTPQQHLCDPVCGECNLEQCHSQNRHLHKD